MTRAQSTQRRSLMPGRVPATAVLTGLLVVTFGMGTTTAVTATLTQHHAAHHTAATPVATPTRTAVAQAAPLRSLVATPKPSQSAKPVTKLVRPKHLVDATLLVSSSKPLTTHQLKALRSIDGVKRSVSVDAGRARVDGYPAFVLGVDPAKFRAWTPKLTAKSNPLWTSIARGELTASFDMGHDAKLPLGSDVPVKAVTAKSAAKKSAGKSAIQPTAASTDASAPAQLRVGAFASVGMAGVDAVMSKQRSRALGLHKSTGIVLSAPKADALVLRKAAQAIVGKHGHAGLLREVIITRDAGEFLTRAQIQTFLKAAASRVGLPYVWGAVGPKSFDCSGLVQWSMARAGIRMPRVSQQQWLAGPHVAYQDALPGDLLFWHYDPTDPTNIDHVAIYAGNGMMLVAPHTGTNVSYKPVPLSNLAGVVRVDPAIAAQI